MTRVCFVADPHVGNFSRHGGPMLAGINWRCRLALDSLTVAVDRARARGADAFVVLGDLCDRAMTEPQVEAALQEVLDPVPAVLLVGNHDAVSTLPNDNALAPLASVAEVVAGDDVVCVGGVDLIMAAWRPGPAREWVRAAVEGCVGEVRPDTTRVLCLHAGIDHDQAPGYLRHDDARIGVEEVASLCRAHGIRYALAGHWHQHRSWDLGDVEVVQLGALCPPSARDDGVAPYGALATLESNGSGGGLLTMSTVPGPRFLRTDGLDKLEEFAQHAAAADVDSVERDRLRAAGVDVAFLKVVLRAGEWGAGRRVVESLPDWVRADVEGDAIEAGKAAAVASAGARAAATPGGAVDEYVAAMPLQDGVDRGEVMELVRRYLSE